MSDPTPIQLKTVRAHLSDMVDSVRFKHQSYLITKQSKPAAVLIGYEDYESLMDMMDTMAEELSPEFQTALQQAHEEYLQGEVVSQTELNEIIKQKLENAK